MKISTKQAAEKLGEGEVRRTKMTTIAAVLLVVSAFAQDAPLPEALVTAKTATVVNGGGVNQKDYDKIVSEITAWKRLTLVETDADVTVVVTAEQHAGTYYNAYTHQMVPMSSTVYRLTFKKSETILYTNQITRGTKRFLEQLDKRLGK